MRRRGQRSGNVQKESALDSGPPVSTGRDILISSDHLKEKVTPPSIEGLSHPIEVLTGLSRQRHMPTKSLEEKFLPECYRAEDVNGKMVCKLPVSIDYDGELRWIKTMCNSNSLPSQYRRHLIGDHLVMGRPDHKSHETMGMKIGKSSSSHFWT
jgi:hypothetical protein